MFSLYKFLGATLAALVPETCRVCQRRRAGPRPGLCDPCHRALPRLSAPCPRCALPDTGGHRCGRCQSRPPAFDESRAACRYAEPVSSLVCALKYGGDLTVVRLLGHLLAECIAAGGDEARPGLLVPVPLHPRRMMQRGFNQSIEIARVASRQLNIPMATDLVRRGRHTPAQQTLDRRQRRANVRGCFQVLRPPPARRIALVDDVMTSGATFDALAAALKRQHHCHVQCFCCARA